MFRRFSLLILAFLSLFCYVTLSNGQTNKPKDQTSTQASKAQAKQDVIKNLLKHYDERIEQFKKENSEIIAKKDKMWEKQIVMLGDSITEGFNLKKAFPDKPFVNRGIVADHIEWLDKKGILYRISPELLAPKPSHIFILIGINDLGDSDTKIDYFISRYKAVLDNLKENYPDAKIFIQSLFPTRGRYARLNNAVLKFNSSLKELADKLKMSYIDLHSLLKDEKGELKEGFTMDGLHIKEPAYEIWKKEIEKALNPEGNIK